MPSGLATGLDLDEETLSELDVVIVAAANERGVLLEINAETRRLDLSDTLVRMARGLGARFVIDTDAHRTAELDFMRYGVDQARRGWCASADIANTRSLEELRELLRRAPAKRPPRKARGAVHSPPQHAHRA